MLNTEQWNNRYNGMTVCVVSINAANLGGVFDLVMIRLLSGCPYLLYVAF